MHACMRNKCIMHLPDTLLQVRMNVCEFYSSAVHILHPAGILKFLIFQVFFCQLELSLGFWQDKPVNDRIVLIEWQDHVM